MAHYESMRSQTPKGPLRRALDGGFVVLPLGSMICHVMSCHGNVKGRSSKGVYRGIWRRWKRRSAKLAGLGKKEASGHPLMRYQCTVSQSHTTTPMSGGVR